MNHDKVSLIDWFDALGLDWEDQCRLFSSRSSVTASRLRFLPSLWARCPDLVPWCSSVSLSRSLSF